MKQKRNSIKQQNPYDNFPNKFFIVEDNNIDDPFHEKTFIGTELGGEGNRLRSYVVISTKNFTPLSAKEKKILKDTFIKILVSINVAIGEIIDEGIIACNKQEQFLRFHYYATNVKRPSLNEIQEYLQVTLKITRRFYVIKGHVSQIVENQYIYNKFREYLKDHKITDMDKAGDFLQFIVDNYKNMAIINVCKQVDNNSKSESLIKLLTDIKANANLYSQEWYHDENEFKNFFNKKTKKAKKTGIETDIAELRQVIGNGKKLARRRDSLVKLRHKQKAHYDKSNFQSKLVFDDLDKAVDVLERMVLKYEVLITGGGQDNLLSANINDYLQFDTLFHANI